MIEEIRVEPTKDHSWANGLIQTSDLYERTKDDTTVDKNLCVLGPNTIVFKVTQGASDCGFFAVVPLAPHIYEIHSYLLPQYRGKFAIRAGNVGCDHMFLGTDCLILTSVCPEWIPESKVFARMCGFQEEFTRKNWVKRDKEWKSGCFVSRNINDWIRQRHQIFTQYGERFHRQLENFLQEKPHEEDSNHDAMVGMVIAMGASFQIYKAVSVYNQWASCARYEAIEIEGVFDDRFSINIKTAIVDLDKNGNIISARRNLCQ